MIFKKLVKLSHFKNHFFFSWNLRETGVYLKYFLATLRISWLLKYFWTTHLTKFLSWVLWEHFLEKVSCKITSVLFKLETWPKAILEMGKSKILLK